MQSNQVDVPPATRQPKEVVFAASPVEERVRLCNPRHNAPQVYCYITAAAAVGM
jgi:hypothetical protein